MPAARADVVKALLFNYIEKIEKPFFCSEGFSYSQT